MRFLTRLARSSFSNKVSSRSYTVAELPSPSRAGRVPSGPRSEGQPSSGCHLIGRLLIPPLPSHTSPCLARGVPLPSAQVPPPHEGGSENSVEFWSPFRRSNDLGYRWDSPQRKLRSRPLCGARIAKAQSPGAGVHPHPLVTEYDLRRLLKTHLQTKPRTDNVTSKKSIIHYLHFYHYIVSGLYTIYYNQPNFHH